MDSSLLLLVVVVLVLAFVASRFLSGNRRSGPPAGTYDDPNLRSGGSIGTGQRTTRTYDDPEIKSGGSIGGSGGATARDRQTTTRTYDDPNIRSGGSLGGSSSVDLDPTEDRLAQLRNNAAPPVNNRAAPRSSGASHPRPRPRDDDERHDDPNIRSGGSFGS